MNQFNNVRRIYVFVHKEEQQRYSMIVYEASHFLYIISSCSYIESTASGMHCLTNEPSLMKIIFSIYLLYMLCYILCAASCGLNVVSQYHSMMWLRCVHMLIFSIIII
jgi:hypothetical protein